MPQLRQSLRQTGGRRVSGQVLTQQVVDNKVVQAGRQIIRLTCVLTPMHPRKIALKQEGERNWKWWDATSVTWLENGWFVLPDHDGLIQYQVMSVADWRQAGYYAFDFVERPRPK